MTQCSMCGKPPEQHKRCSVCGYSKCDAALWLDHDLCKGTIPDQDYPKGKANAN